MVNRLSARDVVMFLLAIAIVFVIWQGGNNRSAAARDADHSVCVRIELLKAGFRDSLNRSLSTLDSYAYYRDHPVEKGKAIAEIRRQIRLYAPINC